MEALTSSIDTRCDSYDFHVGYCLKDVGDESFKAKVYKIGPKHLQDCYNEYQRAKRHDDADGNVVHHRDLLREVRSFTSRTFGATTHVSTLEGTYFMLDRTELTLDKDVVTGANGSVFNSARCDAWFRIRTGAFTIEDVARCLFDNDYVRPLECDVSNERFEELASKKEDARPTVCSNDLRAFGTDKGFI